MTVAHAEADALVALLESERQLIRDGRFIELGSLQEDKARLFARLESDPPPAVALDRLRARAASNLALLAAARDGFAAAQARLRELERLARGGAGYDRHGAQVEAPSDPRTSRRV